MKKILSFVISFNLLFMTSCVFNNKNLGQDNFMQSENEPQEVIDFIVDVEEGRDIRVLQLTDTQIIDSAQQRSDDRLGEEQTARWATEQMDNCLFKYIRNAVERAQPDLIIITGDLVYGEFDDSGRSFKKLIAHMEGYGIPWAPIYGNHDNESMKGAKWQNEQLMSAEHCLFKKGDTDGNGNYTVGIRQGEEIKRVFYMLDSNSCGAAYDAYKNEVITSYGFTKTQLKWLYNLMEDIKEMNEGTPIPASACWHIPTQEFVEANRKYFEQQPSFTIGKTIEGDEGDFGSLKEDGGIKGPFDVPTAAGKNFLEQLKNYAIDSVFVGHSHCVNTSIMYEGIRWTFGLKTGTYDRWTPGEVGGTLITFGEKVKVEHLYY